MNVSFGAVVPNSFRNGYDGGRDGQKKTSMLMKTLLLTEVTRETINQLTDIENFSS